MTFQEEQLWIESYSKACAAAISYLGNFSNVLVSLTRLDETLVFESCGLIRHTSEHTSDKWLLYIVAYHRRQVTGATLMETVTLPPVRYYRKFKIGDMLPTPEALSATFNSSEDHIYKAEASE